MKHPVSSDEEEVDGEPGQPTGLLSKLFSVFTPAKRTRLEPNQPTPTIVPSSSKTAQPTTRTLARTEYVSQNPQTPFLMATMPKSAVTSIKKGRAQVFFTPESGLVYTSPNTIEMGDLTNNPGSGRRVSKRARRVMTQVGKNSVATRTEIVKLTFDSPRGTTASQT